MIKFKELSSGLGDGEVEYVLSAVSGADCREVEEIIESFLQMSREDPDISVAISAYADCLLVRIFDMGRYMFVYPIALTDAADDSEACDMIRAYAVKEEIPLVFCDVPAERLGDIVSSFRHVSADAEDYERGSYRVEVHSECALLDSAPVVSFGDMEINAICDEDGSDYAELCRSREVNRFWGYDFRDDIECPDDGYFTSTAAAELARGTALSLAVRQCGKMIGELTFYSFDLKGGAEVAFRILPSYQGRGLGRRIVEASLELAKDMGLIKIYATVKEENERSLHLVSSVMKEEGRADGKVRYCISL